MSDTDAAQATSSQTTQRGRSAGDEMTLFEHLAELRMRLVRCALAVTIGAVVVLAFYNTVLGWLLRPYAQICATHAADKLCGSLYDPSDGTVSLIITDPLEGFGTRVRIAGYGGVVLALPVLLWQLWRFVVPALHKHERRYAFGFVASTLTLFAFGGAMAYLTLGKAIEFLIQFSGQDILATFRVQSYVRLVTLMVVAFGIGFTAPVMLVFLEVLNVLSYRTLLRQWRYAIVGIFVIAAGITPSADPYSLLALSVPMVLFYFVAILIGWLIQRKRPREADSDTTGTEAASPPAGSGS